MYQNQYPNHCLFKHFSNFLTPVAASNFFFAPSKYISNKSIIEPIKPSFSSHCNPLRLQYTGPKTWDQELKFMTSAAAPPAPVLARMADYGIEVSALEKG